MIKEYSIAGKNVNAIKKFKIWIDEFPFDPFKCKNLEDTIHVNKTISIPDIRICLEYFLPRNISNYAMLGLEFKNTNDKNLKVFLYNCMDGIDYKPSVQCTDKNCKHKGFLLEYGHTVMEQTAQFFKSLNCGVCGELNFVIGGYCDIGSSIASFNLATNILLRLLLNHDEQTILRTISEV